MARNVAVIDTDYERLKGIGGAYDNLTKDGAYQIKNFDNLGEALLGLRFHGFDVIVSEMQIPYFGTKFKEWDFKSVDEIGLKIGEELKNPNNVNHNTPWVVYTATNTTKDDKIINKYLDLGAKAVLEKIETPPRMKLRQALDSLF